MRMGRSGVWVLPSPTWPTLFRPCDTAQASGSCQVPGATQSEVGRAAGAGQAHPAPQAAVRANGTAVEVSRCERTPPAVKEDNSGSKPLGRCPITYLAMQVGTLQCSIRAMLTGSQHTPAQQPSRPQIHVLSARPTQQRRRWSDRRPHACASPIATEDQVNADATWTGSKRCTVDPSPSWPASLRPCTCAFRAIMVQPCWLG